ncbi:hypothetical protein F5Y03DRAFT_26440 [Xylaria venustula]|nr:hypothetical protein F5Y03DRAFT_26440 [Xylaria venustula]
MDKTGRNSRQARPLAQCAVDVCQERLCQTLVIIWALARRAASLLHQGPLPRLHRPETVQAVCIISPPYHESWPIWRSFEIDPSVTNRHPTIHTIIRHGGLLRFLFGHLNLHIFFFLVLPTGITLGKSNQTKVPICPRRAIPSHRYIACDYNNEVGDMFPSSEACQECPAVADEIR